MRMLVFLVFVLPAGVASAAGVNLLSMDAPAISQYVRMHTHAAGTSFGDQNVLVGPSITERIDGGKAKVKLIAYIPPKSGVVLVGVEIATSYTANLWAFYRSAVLDDGTSIDLGKVSRDFGDCEENGCDYFEVMTVDIPPLEMKAHVGKSMGLRIYGDNAVATLTLPAGYINGFTDAIMETQH